MDHTVTGKGPSSVRFHQYIPHPTHEVGYQRIRIAFGSKVPWFASKIHPNRNGVLYISSLGTAYQYVVKIEQKFKQRNKREFGSTNASQ